MKSYTLQILYSILATSMFAGQGVAAATVYQWTDKEGIVHFSDTPPKGDGSLEIRETEYSVYAGGVAGDEYSIMNQLERMTEWRRQTEEERMARKQLQLEEKRLAREQHAGRYTVPPSRTVYKPVYYYQSYYPSYGYFDGFSHWHHKPHWRHSPKPGKGGHSRIKGFSKPSRVF